MQRLTYTAWMFAWLAIGCMGALPLGARALSEPAVDVARDSLPRVSLKAYPFLNTKANKIEETQGLAHFLEQLSLLEQGEIPVVRIVHIGDSHVLGDLWAGPLRSLLQERFGTAGRGLVFPYALAGTGGPRDVSITGSSGWSMRPWQGLAGMSLYTQDADFLLDLSLQPDSVLDNSFDKLTIFSAKGPSNYDFNLGNGEAAPLETEEALPPARRYHKVRKGDTLGALAKKYRTSVRNLQQWNRLRGTRLNVGQRLVVSGGGKRAPRAKKAPSSFTQLGLIPNAEYPPAIFQASIVLDEPVHQVFLRGLKYQDTQQEATIHGFSLENTQNSGILYHSIGVNGATFQQYGQATDFVKQVAALQPDLVIVSLGTNESVDARLKANELEEAANGLLALIRAQMPSPSLLLTTNPAILQRGRPNAGNAPVRDVLLRVAQAQEAAVWDLQAVMGTAADRMKKWQNADLAQRDGVHFTAEGYALQAELFFQALIASFDAKR